MDERKYNFGGPGLVEGEGCGVGFHHLMKKKKSPPKKRIKESKANKSYSDWVEKGTEEAERRIRENNEFNLPLSIQEDRI